MNHAPITANATFAATLCDQWVADGLRAAFVAPGSRSTPLALALVEHGGIDVQILHDERSASFAALGHGLATGTPAVLLCSSGTAGAHFYAAVIEADASAMPMIVVTADRPPELWGRGAPQTIDQTHLYGHRVRAFVEPGPPDELDPSRWREIARGLWTAATGTMPGPVHANLSFRDPLTGTAGPLPADLPAIAATGRTGPEPGLVGELADLLTAQRGVIIAGRGESSPADVLRLADSLGWPVLADHRSGCRDPQSPAAVRHFDSLLRSTDFAERHRPDVVLRLGEIVSSKATSQWLSAAAAHGATIVSGRPHGRHIDPEAIASRQFDEAGVAASLADRFAGGSEKSEQRAEDPPETGDAWLDSWLHADRIAATAIDRVLAEAPKPNEVMVSRAALAAVPTGGALVVASSMPIRDLEWFGANRNDLDVHANRGANGIDGTIATAIGIARNGPPTVCLIGDIALLHDSTSLVALRDRDVDLTIVVTDNDGGGIFSFLPQHELLDTERYERLFGTPHGTDLAGLVAAHGLPCDVFDGTIPPPDGVRVVIARTERLSNLEIHDRLHGAVAEALASLPSAALD